MTIDDRLSEFKIVLDKIKEDMPRKYTKIQLYTNSCLGVEQDNCVPCPENDILNLRIELVKLSVFHREYRSACTELYQKVNRIVESNKRYN